MSLRLNVEVEELQLARDGYCVVVRANQYEDRPSSVSLGNESITLAQSEKVGTLATFTVQVPRVVRRKRKRERAIEDIEKSAKTSVLQLCRQIADLLEAKP